MTDAGGGVVLVVDDDAVSRRLAQWQLDKLGYRAESVASGERALNQLELRTYAAILMACGKPGLDGYATTREIRQRETTRTLIIATTSVQNREAALDAGMDDVLVKPIDIRDLAARLRHHLGSLPAAADLLLARPDEFSAEVRALVKGEASEGVVQLRLALDRADAVTVEQYAHSLLGASGQAGLTDIAALATELGGLAGTGDLSDRAQELVARIRKAVDEL